MREQPGSWRSRFAGHLALAAALATFPAVVPSPTAAEPRGPAATARAHLAGHPLLAGLDPAALRTVSVTEAPSGDDLVRFQQRVDGVPVVAGQLVAMLDASGRLATVRGEVSLGTVATSYDVPASTAARTARAAVARSTGIPPADLRTGRPRRAYYDASLVERGGAPGARAVWSVHVRAVDDPAVRERFLIDAATGQVALRTSGAPALARVVCDNADVASAGEICAPGRYTRVEGQGPTGIPDVDSVYDLTGATATWFSSRLGVDLTALIGSDEGDGPKLRSTVRYCGPEGCPFENAFWNGEQMVYGTGFTSADDVVAHELAHGLSQQTAGLVYWYQSGALSESLSDVFGELVDLSNGLGDDDPSVRWQLGEDLPASAGGVTRHMANPPLFGQPDSTSSPFFDPAVDYEDSGAVHVNSGVPNKTAYLIADGTGSEPGGSFAGRSFPGIGADRTGVLHWFAMQLLTPGSDFADLAAALSAACTSLAATGSAGFTSTECVTVDAAVASTGLARWSGPGAPERVRAQPGVSSVRLRWDPPVSGRRSVSSYVVWVRPAPLPGEEFALLEPSATDYVLRGLRAGTDYQVGVVAVSAEGTSASVVRRFTGSRLEVRWPGDLTYGERLQVRGTLRRADGGALADRQVSLLRRDRRGAQYELLDRVRTGPSGRFRLRGEASRTAEFVVLFDGGRRLLGDRTPVELIRVRRAVGLVSR